ncbi:MAG: glutamate--tRNA ligase [Gammaproteobacteria bacterium]|nr:glutamate--tRNA ligase [Gammaproteobacteria bacterium]
MPTLSLFKLISIPSRTFRWHGLKNAMKSRFAPSPTGLIHMGNARTALFSALFAHGQQGTFLLRIEDTDLARSKKEYVDHLMDDLHWLGIEWQEGPGQGGDHGPYFQAERGPIYQKYYDQLLAEGHAYPCFCSEAQLEMTRKMQRISGQPPRYSGTCRHLSDEERQKKRASGLPEAIRFKLPEKGVIEFEDGVRGKQRFLCDDIGDFIIRKTDQTASFMFCNAIDDSLMGVTHVIRGEDHFTNTPRQLVILEALNLKKPNYAHLSLIAGEDGAKLSKREGSRSIQALKEEGFFPLAVINYLARLGHYYASHELMSFSVLAQEFKIENLGKSPARFNEDQLEHWQKQVLQKLSQEELWDWITPEAKSLVPEHAKTDFITLIRETCLLPTDALPWAERLFKDPLEIDEAGKAILAESPAEMFIAAIESLKTNGAIQRLSKVKS